MARPTHHYPLIAPNPPRLSAHGEVLARVEASGIFSNNGPELKAFEAEVTDGLFGGAGASLGVANATLGLMLAIRQAAGARLPAGGLAIVPALTFAATAQAAWWAGLTPVVTDVDRETWSMCPHAEEQLLRRHGDRVRVLVPYAAFGAAIDLDRYAWLAKRHGVGVVIDAASSLGTIDAAGRGFGAEARFAVVYSMHATKTFSVGEGGLVHSGDPALIATLRAMAGFGFEGERSATLPGLNAKLAELPAAMARLKLAELDGICDRRAAAEAVYRAALGDDFGLQAMLGRRRAMQFMPVLLPARLATRRDEVATALATRGIGTGSYFSPHLGQQPWMRANAMIEATPVADEVAGRMLSLPITDATTAADALAIADTLRGVCTRLGRRLPARVAPRVAGLLVVGGGPAGTALLTAAAKAGRLRDLAAAGLVVAECGPALGGGQLGEYGITSDSTARTFLSAVEDNPEPSLSALTDHPAACAVDRYRDALGVPLIEADALLRATGDRLAGLIIGGGGTVLSGHEALGTRRTLDGLWRTRLRRGSDGREIEQLSQAVVIATGGYQAVDQLATRPVAGTPLAALAGERLVGSDDVLRIGGLERIAERLAGRPDPRIAVIGGSTSALATVTLLLRRTPALALGEGAITLLHRRPLRPWYPSAAAALADGFTDWGPDDVCPVSGFVYRLAGFRLEARELVLRMLEVGGRRREPRVQCHQLDARADPAAHDLLRRADVVVAALGYRPRALPVEDASGASVALAADAGRSMVDRHCRVVDASGTPLPGLYGIGLAAGFVPWGAMGGEASFRGQANGLWQWQNDVGRMIVEQVLGTPVLGKQVLGTRAAARAAA